MVLVLLEEYIDLLVPVVVVVEVVASIEFAVVPLGVYPGTMVEGLMDSCIH